MSIKLNQTVKKLVDHSPQNWLGYQHRRHHKTPDRPSRINRINKYKQKVKESDGEINNLMI